nr:MAG TPA: hypothetical protein [Caudoviricetes sp.]
MPVAANFEGGAAASRQILRNWFQFAGFCDILSWRR